MKTNVSQTRTRAANKISPPTYLTPETGKDSDAPSDMVQQARVENNKIKRQESCWQSLMRRQDKGGGKKARS